MPAGAGSYLDSGQSCSCRRGEYSNVLQLHWHAAGVFMITTLTIADLTWGFAVFPLWVLLISISIFLDNTRIRSG